MKVELRSFPKKSLEVHKAPFPSGEEGFGEALYWRERKEEPPLKKEGNGFSPSLL